MKYLLRSVIESHAACCEGGYPEEQDQQARPETPTASPAAAAAYPSANRKSDKTVKMWKKKNKVVKLFIETFVKDFN